MKHPHSHAAIIKAMGGRVDYIYPPIPIRIFDWCVTLEDGEPVVGSGRTCEAAAIDALDSPDVWARLKIWGEA